MDGSLLQNLASRAASLLLAILLVTAPAHAMMDDEEEPVMGYDTILQELNREAAAARPAATARAKQPPSSNPFDTIWIHFGLGLSGLMQELRFDDGTYAQLNQRGVQAALGIDLFSEHFMAEGTARSFGESDDSSVRAQVQEFELKMIYKDRVAKNLGFRAGLGVTGRYLNVKRRGQIETLSYTTPTTVGTMGIDWFLTERFSIGADVSARSAMITETVDHNSFDATIRLDTHF